MRKFTVFGTSVTSGGNPMGIVTQPENALNSGVPVTVLISNSDIADSHFRFFYPNHKESPLCGHALLGASASINAEHFFVETGAGICEVKKRAETIFVKLEKPHPVVSTFDDTLEAKWLGLDESEIVTYGVFSAGKAKLCIEVASVSVLKKAVFDSAILAQWNRNKNFSGYVLYVQEKDELGNIQYYARATNPLFNIAEDSACAVCCAALPIELNSTSPFIVLMGAPEFCNELHLEHAEQGIWVGGKVFAI
ncbi:PhzF family phenazine biosynthesis protein [Photobacterium frigidiphilum]|uniref:PhzF family phenazine biosynthesis protein n=1 Tax=Photobacterium frigidiphilum TaxID=264736 RepID=UPI003D107A8D